MSQIAHRVLVRPAGPCDEAAIGQLFAALHAYNASLDPRFALADGWEALLHEHLRHHAEHAHGLTLLAWDGATPIGLLMIAGHSDSPLFRHRHWAEILALYVDPQLHGHGIADDLIANAMAWAHQQGYERIQLHVTAHNLRARKFYARQGFRCVQEIWRYEIGPTDHAPPEDPTCTHHYAHGRDLLGSHPHHLAIEPE
jgi:ribosomal protein S18 acetylase RimI-like enzyme